MLFAHHKSQFNSIPQNNWLRRIFYFDILGYYLEFDGPLGNQNLKFTPLYRFNYFFPSNNTYILESPLCADDFFDTFDIEPNGFNVDDLKNFNHRSGLSVSTVGKMYLSSDQLKFILSNSEYVVFSGCLMDVNEADQRMDQDVRYQNVTNFFTLKIEGTIEDLGRRSTPTANSILGIKIEFSGGKQNVKLNLAYKKRSEVKHGNGILHYILTLLTKKKNTDRDNPNKPRTNSMLPLPLLFAGPGNAEVPITTAAVPCPPNWDEL